VVPPFYVAIKNLEARWFGASRREAVEAELPT
jgi:hypothetical protein